MRSRNRSTMARDGMLVMSELNHEHVGKTDVRIIDFVDTGHPALLRMWDKRQHGYRAMGYRLGADETVG